jgi:hypothetical protein
MSDEFHGADALIVAGQPVPDPIGIFRTYALRTKTLQKFDLAGRGEPQQLTREEVLRTRIISSRISYRETDDWFIPRAADADALWSAVPPCSDLRDADPAEIGGLYDAALNLYQHFLCGSPRGIGVAKASKVLHVKRPGLYPLLDSRLIKRYRQCAKQKARRYPQRNARRLYWAAIRADLLAAKDNGALVKLRRHLKEDTDPNVRSLNGLTDLRLLDICTWSSPA